MSIRPLKAYKNLDFLNSPDSRAIRILCEYEEPIQRFAQHDVSDTLVFFGSARAKPLDVAEKNLSDAQDKLEQSNSSNNDALKEALRLAKNAVRLAHYYEKTRELARRLTEWDMNRDSERRYLVCTGGGPGIMEAANRGASEVPGGKSIGLGISLPFEEALNPYVSPELAFEFHYFFTRKYWFLYLCKAMVICPGGFGTFDEFFESLTLRQTGKVRRNLPTVLFGTEYWTNVFNPHAMAEWGTISPDDINLYFITDSVDDAFDYLVDLIVKAEAEGVSE
jgi:uncharacterized protein (TIGR00730 family)